jgi:hypothetical protein
VGRRAQVGLVLVSLLGAGCLGGPVPQVNAIVEVFNETNNADKVEWHGTSTGSEPIAPCSADTEIDFGPGTWELTITDGSFRQTLSLTAPATGGFYEVLDIGPDGQISDLYTGPDQHSVPPRPAGWAFCMGN